MSEEKADVVFERVTSGYCAGDYRTVVSRRAGTVGLIVSQAHVDHLKSQGIEVHVRETKSEPR